MTDALLPLAADDVALTNDDWYTPRWLFSMAELVFDLDVCAPVDPEMRTCPALRYLTALDDGLIQPWDGLVWMNPPFSQRLPWIQRFAAHPGGGLALVPATKSTATQTLLWCADELAFITGQFHRPNGRTDHNPWLLMLAARGHQASKGLRKVAKQWGTPAWAVTR